VFAETGTRRPAQPGALFRIASITKTFTGTAVMQLRDAGRLGLDDLPSPICRSCVVLSARSRRSEAVTIRRMLSHESGLEAEPREPTGPSQSTRCCRPIYLATDQ